MRTPAWPLAAALLAGPSPTWLAHRSPSVWQRSSASGAGKESHLSSLRRTYRWTFEELLKQCRAQHGGTQTCVLIDGPLHAANVGCIMRQAAVLQPPGSEDGISAVLLAASNPPKEAKVAKASFPSEKFLKNVVRISLAERQSLPSPTRLVTLSQGPLTALRALREEGFVLVALENLEACSPSEPYPATVSLWNLQLPLNAPRLAFVAGGEAQSLQLDLLQLCDWQSYIPAARCPLNVKEQNVGEETHNPTLNLAHAVVIALYERRRQLASQQDA